MGKKFLVGYALKWNAHSFPMTVNGKRCVETFEKGAFQSYLGRMEPFVLSYHDSKIILGRKNVNAEIYEDEIGLRFIVELPNTSAANDMYELVQRGIVKGVSIGFRAITESWGMYDRTTNLRTVKEALLAEFSFVGSPAYGSSEVHALTEEEYLELQVRNKTTKRKRLFLLASL